MTGPKHLALLAPLLLGAGCHEPADVIARQMAGALTAGDPEAALRHVHADYADPRGDRDRLAADLREMQQAFSRARVDFEDLSAVEGQSARESVVVGRLDAEWVGSETWRVAGPVELYFTKEDGFRAQSGLLTHVRDIRQLMAARRAALEANDATGIGALLHPRYADGDIDAAEAVARLRRDLEGAPIRLRATNYRLEVRGPIAHVDEHYVLTVGDRTLPPAVARFTLEPSVGRWRIRAGLYPETD